MFDADDDDYDADDDADADADTDTGADADADTGALDTSDSDDKITADNATSSEGNSVLIEQFLAQVSEVSECKGITSALVIAQD